MIARALERAALLVAGGAVLAAAAPIPQAEAAPPGCVGPVSDTWIHVSVSGVRSSNGLVAVTVYADDRSRFLVKRGSVGVMRMPAQQGETRGCVYLPGRGVWALAIYHDEDGDQQFDRSGIGLPREGYGFTNNPSTVVGLPSFASVRLSVPKPGLLTRIRVKYP
ncbi:uncharacterized protein (DUF2141 family) [Novosphingobium kunmingense]|uniref:Uncharacterized protein (DUF2141 family) n=1 Tax=Novosphingobium kunmingense TaxID=1211806 RepID=A0A2N0H5E4_9SPHN|nr:DUF2141 domain-containing protein [Novosphingobium kunmingense]PKB14149.1 uncharacterized protein (DUF2141 family) [Novosphingobium kunmingense]